MLFHLAEILIFYSDYYNYWLEEKEFVKIVLERCKEVFWTLFDHCFKHTRSNAFKRLEKKGLRWQLDF
jgi:hypothetical protein